MAAPLDEPEDIVQFYDPTDVFGDLAEAHRRGLSRASRRSWRDEDDGTRPADDAADADRLDRAWRRGGAPANGDASCLDAELLEIARDPARPVPADVSTPRGWRPDRGPASSSTCGRPTTPGLVLRRPFSINTVDRPAGTFTIHFRITGRGTDWLARARPGETARDPRPARSAVRGRPAHAPRAARRRRPGHGRRARPGRRGAGRRPARDAPLRRSVGGGGLSQLAAADRGRVRRRHRRRHRSATTAR